MTTWYWVRHGPTHEKAFCGWRDVPADLSDSARLARLNAALPADAFLVSSDLIRATATAAVLPGRTSLPATAALREFNFGQWDGMTFADVAARDPALSRTFWEEPGDTAPPGGESWNMVASRVNRFVSDIHHSHPGGQIIAVAHIGVILTQLAQALSIPPQAALCHHIGNLSVTQLHHDQGRWQAVQINHTP